MKYNLYIPLLFIAFVFVSCNDYLDQAPDNRASLTNAKTIRELLVSAYPDQSYQVFTEAMSDNVTDRGAQANELAVSSPSALISQQAYSWQDIKGDNQDTPTAYWTSCYNAISAANHALEAIKNLGGGVEYDPIKGEALLCRAYAHFMLVNIFAEHYNPQTAATAQGVPYVTVPEKVVFNDYKRNTIAEVYANILSDFETGFPLLDDATYIVPAYHFTRNAASAFASRLFLYTNKPDSVIKYANIVLGTSPQTKIRDWNGIYQTYTSQDAISSTYNKADQPTNLLLTACVSFIMRSSYNRFAMDFGLLNTIGYNVNITGGKNGFLFYGASAYNFVFVPKYKEYFKRESINANYGLGYSMIPMLTADEVLLNRAEGYVMLNDFENALADINVYYSKRVLNYNPAVHTVTANRISNYIRTDRPVLAPDYAITPTQLPYIKLLLEMRRSEFILEGLRWFDIKRMHLEVKHNVLTGEASPVVLSPTDARRAVQIPIDALSFGISPNGRPDILPAIEISLLK
ncbi:MAG: hypothetical protein AUK44_10325 [Porphyromonadaceae bacterium CG2_30_38_12]|nr:MAG: hypothetical protein AUK44_10325 [Porphyromonadaceae bacterium CG2_30_38_12]